MASDARMKRKKTPGEVFIKTNKGKETKEKTEDQKDTRFDGDGGK